jgi:hypothetical protein
MCGRSRKTHAFRRHIRSHVQIDSNNALPAFGPRIIQTLILVKMRKAHSEQPLLAATRNLE